MSLTPAMIDAMVAAGCTAQQIAAVVKADLIDRENALSSKRGKDAARQRKHRMSRDVTVTECDPAPPNDNNSNPPTQTTSDEVVTAKRRPANACQMPEGWEPVLTPAAQSVVDRWPPGFFDRTLSGFRNHAADKGRKSKDWQAAFRTWIDNADKWKPKDARPTASNDEPQNPYVRAVIARQAERSRSVGG